MGFFSLKSVPGATQTELQARGNRQWDPSLGQAKTWIHVMSLAEGRSKILKTFESYSGAYENNRPKYVITGFKLNAKGEFGTTRQGDLSMTIFNDNEFNSIADAYLIPDMSVRVQFGWSVGSDGKAAPAALEGVMTDSEAIKAMHNLASNSPIYEGYQGRVVGWDVKYRPEISAWDLTLQMVGAADSVSETGLDYSTKKCQCKKELTGQQEEQNQGEEEVVKQTSDLEAVAIQLFDDPANLGSIDSLKGAPNLLAEEIAYPGFSRDIDGTEDTSTIGIPSDLDARETFVSWGTVEAMFTRCSGQQFCGKDPCSYILDSSNVILKAPQAGGGNWFSGDPRVCILPGGGLTFQEPTEWTDRLAATIVFAPLAAVIDAFSGTAGFPQPSKNCFTGDGVKLVDILVSTVHLNKRIREFLQGEVKLMQAINSLLKDINVACGGVWELEVIDSTIDSGDASVVQLTIVDSNDSDGAPSFTFVTEAGSGFCRDVQIDFKPTDAMKTQALYGNQGDSKETGTGGACSSRFMIYSKDGPKNLGKKTGTTEHPNTCNSDICNEANQTEDPKTALEKKVTQITVDGALNYLREQKREADKQRLSGQAGGYCAAPILPIGLGVTVGGIGGFRWGQGVSCDRLPPDIRNRLNWQVTSVEHNLSADDWVTTIKTVGRVKG
jgi:hypothetical protein